MRVDHGVPGLGCARAPPPARGAVVLPSVPHGRVDEAAAARDAFARRMGSRYSSPSLVSPRWKVDIEFFLTSLLRRFGGVKGSLAGGRAGAGLPMRQWGREPQHLAQSSSRRRRPVSGSLAPSGYASSLPALASALFGSQSLLASLVSYKPLGSEINFRSAWAWQSHRPATLTRTVALQPLNYYRERW